MNYYFYVFIFSHGLL